MNSLELLRLSRRLARIAEEAMPPMGLHQLPSSVRAILLDVFDNPESSIGEITTRTGFPQSHVSSAVARLREGGAFVTTTDEHDRRRTVVRPSPEALRRAAGPAALAPIDRALAAALGAGDPAQVAGDVAALESLSRRLFPEMLMQPRPPPDFEAVYATAAPPWDIGRPQPALQRLADAGALRGRVLDAGCGTGEHALMAAALGLDAMGIDIAPAAIAAAEAKARDRGLAARFLVGDALDLAGLGERFDTVLDSGLFHVFDDESRARYVDALGAAIVPGGRCHLLCFSDRQPGAFGPRRVAREEIRASFANGWRVESIEETRMLLAFRPEGAIAWLAAIERL
ncbi:MAG TPA: methyltransferase domain-containing protein [Candidatus Dormibacteraeota bacterium]